MADRAVTYPTLPSPVLRSVINVWLVVHLGLLALVLSTTVVVTPLQRRMLDLASPYLLPLHLRMHSAPLTISPAESGAGQLDLQWRPGPDQAWRPWRLPSHDFLEQRRVAKYVRSIVEASERDDTGTAAMLALPWVRQIMDTHPPDTASAPEMRVVTLSRPVSIPGSPADLPRSDRTPSRSVNVIEHWRGAIVTRSTAAGSAADWSLVTLGERRLNASGLPTE